MVKLTHDEAQRVKTAFLSYSQGQSRVPEAMMDQLICGAVPGLTWEQLQARKPAKNSSNADGYDRSAFFALVASDPVYVQFIAAHFPCAPEEERAPEIDALELKTQKGF
ncbi:uncharacterized protein TM35_000152550 [Trypanosoma theileri]|uniref:Uncharacterized protein n=1 Tax=Trypanosoma theileri TaxID=67003 RepID=A0A1X0NVT9_9TRYP|nr:uncharacterized protein TM35_000152550 [Trypanosoma theileri]ORC88824.1 hypothetical protein TM35_000152550 [Trypanosoma theileri]